MIFLWWEGNQTKFCNLSEKRLTVLKFKLKLNLKFMLKESKTIKIIKGIKNRRGLRKSYITQGKAI